MVWDLGRAMRKKEEFESARLMDFEFRQRVRATRLLANALGLDASKLVREMVESNEDGLLAAVADACGLTKDEVSSRYRHWLGQARKELIAERGDPTPYRLG